MNWRKQNAIRVIKRCEFQFRKCTERRRGWRRNKSVKGKVKKIIVIITE